MIKRFIYVCYNPNCSNQKKYNKDGFCPECGYKLKELLKIPKTRRSRFVIKHVIPP